MLIKNALRSKKAISPILATLILIVIAATAIVLTYAWIVTYMGSETQQAGFVPYKANVAFLAGNRIVIGIGNSGTSNGQIIQVYVGTKASDELSRTTNPSTPITIAPSSVESFAVTYNWTSGTTFYFKVIAGNGATLTFSEQAG